MMTLDSKPSQRAIYVFSRVVLNTFSLPGVEWPFKLYDKWCHAVSDLADALRQEYGDNNGFYMDWESELVKLFDLFVAGPLPINDLELAALHVEVLEEANGS